jgi:hypothetical protein
MSKFIFLILIYFFLYACTYSPNDYNTTKKTNEASSDSLVGMWYATADTSEKIEFTTDGYFNKYSIGIGKWAFKFSKMENGKLIDKDYGQMKYTVKKNGDSLMIMLIGEKNQEIFAKRLFFLDGESCLTEVVYKEGIDTEGIDISNYIQTGNGYSKSKTQQKCSIDAPRMIYKLPKSFTSKIVFVAFGQNDGIVGEINKKENTISYDVPDTNIIKIKELENVKSVTWKLFDFYINTEDGTLKKMKMLYYDDIYYFKKQWYNEQVKFDYDIDQLVVLPSSRFNPDTKTVKSYFGKYIKGNVWTFEVVNLKEQLESWGIDLDYVEYPKQK